MLLPGLIKSTRGCKVFCKRQFCSRVVTSMAANEQLSQIQTLMSDVMSGGSAIATESKTKQLCSTYSGLQADGKYLFLKLLAQNFGVDRSLVEHAIQNFTAGQDQGDAFRLKSQERLKLSLTPQYSTVFRNIGRLEGGVKFLVDLRTDVLTLISTVANDNPFYLQLQAVNSSLHELLSLWFSVGFLTLRRITWESSCNMLQKVSEYEAVHPVRNWTDLKKRVGPYRRCYVFTHSSMPVEPIVVLHTALTATISSSIQSIVLPQRLHSEGDVLRPAAAQVVEDQKKIQAAVFYSISSSQKGLQGIDLGNQLIKRVVREVQEEFSHVCQFSSLSPIPGFRDWLLMEVQKVKTGDQPGSNCFSEKECTAIEERACRGEESSLSVWDAMIKLLKNNGWFQDPRLVEALQVPFMRLCSHYLYKEKRRGYALNGVAHFHLRNGAVMWRLNWLADSSPRGLGSSCGMMVNYRYFLEELESHSQRYVDHRHVEASDQFLHNLEPPPPQSAL